MLERFRGTVEPLAEIPSSKVKALSDWIEGIPLEDWPQQRPYGAPLQPAMQTNAEWHGFGLKFDPLVAALMKHFPKAIPLQRMLSVVMPGDEIPPHVDGQSPEWICRVHVPLVGDAKSVFIMDDGEHRLEVGKAYRVNTEARHAVKNRGKLPRIHFMFDVRT